MADRSSAPATPSAPPPAPPPATAVEPPHVPRPRLSGRAIALGGFGALVIAGYAAVAYTNFEPGSPERDEIPASVRSSPGGYRSFHFWHSGYHGGK
jgi:hypothetical protein